MITPKADLEGFGDAIAQLCGWPEDNTDLEFSEIFDTMKQYNLVREIPGGFNPEIHECPYGCSEEGDPWYEWNYVLRREPAQD